MGNGKYISLLNSSGSSGHVALFSASKGGETAGSVAYSSSNTVVAFYGGETAGSVASSYTGGSSSCGSSCGSFTAIA